jgi:hypothetical protein
MTAFTLRRVVDAPGRAFVLRGRGCARRSLVSGNRSRSAAGWVVEALAAGEDCEASLRPVSERFLLDQFALERRREGFGHGIVIAIPD